MLSIRIPQTIFKDMDSLLDGSYLTEQLRDGFERIAKSLYATAISLVEDNVELEEEEPDIMDRPRLVSVTLAVSQAMLGPGFENLHEGRLVGHPPIACTRTRSVGGEVGENMMQRGCASRRFPFGSPRHINEMAILGSFRQKSDRF